MKNIKNFLFLILFQIFYLNCEEYKNLKYHSYDDIWEIFLNLSKTCPEFIKIDTSQNRYNLPNGGICGKENKPCQNLIVFLTDHPTMNVERPQIYISGLLHGDEVIGATTLTEFALYFCNNKNENSWVLDLLKKVYFVFTPFTNAYGYSHESREDFVVYNNNRTGFEDPNRDFPYFKRNSHKCMMTITARTINELFREHIFINAITFHGGANSIGYPWGNEIHLVTNQKGTEAPDYESLKNIGQILKKFSSSQKDHSIPDYQLGDMNEITYPVEGGMEDWAYAGSWENKNSINNLLFDPIKQCNPNTFGGYFSNQTKYDNSTARTLIYLVETANMKKPYEFELGTLENVFDIKGKFYGHIPRNMRLVASIADISKTSVRIEEFNKEINDNKFYFNYKIMGCKEIDDVRIYKIHSKNFFTNFNIKFFRDLSKNTHDIVHNMSQYIIDNKMNISYELNNIVNSTCFWNYDTLGFETNYRLEIDYKNYFELNEKLVLNKSSPYQLEAIIYLISAAHFDSSWQGQIKPDPQVAPQSHLVNSKSKNSYLAENDNFILQSSSHVSSYPVILFQNGHMIKIDDYEALFINNNDISLQTSIFRLDSENSILKYKVLSKISIEYLDIINKSKTSQILYEMNIHFYVIDKKIVSNDLFDNLNYTDSTKNKIIILLDDEIIETLCDVFYKNKSFYYIKCNPFATKNLNTNFIRNQLLSSLINIELELEEENYSLISSFQLNNKAITGKYITSKEIICMSNLHINLLNKHIFNIEQNLEITNNLNDDLYDFVIIFKKRSQLNWSISLEIKSNSDLKNEKNFFIVLENNFELNFTGDDVIHKKEKMIKLNPLYSNIIGNVIDIYSYNEKIENVNNFEDLNLRAKNNYSYSKCTLIEKKEVTQNDINKFFDLTRVHNKHKNLNPKSNEYFIPIGIISICLFIVIIIIYIIKIKIKGKNAYKTINNEVSEEVQIQIQNINRNNNHSQI